MQISCKFIGLINQQAQLNYHILTLFTSIHAQFTCHCIFVYFLDQIVYIKRFPASSLFWFFLVKETMEKIIKKVLVLRSPNNYSEIRVDMERIWNKETCIVPITIGALGSIPKHLGIYLKKLDIPYSLITL